MNYQWLKNLDFKTIIDVGANEGQAANNFLGLFPRAEFYCFEPLPEPFKDLSKRFKNSSNFHLYDFALGNESGEKKMFRNEYSLSSSILPMEEAHKEAFVNTKNEFEEQITIKKLDDVFKNIKLNKPLLVKIDVQGFELEVIKGGSNIISDADMIILETSFVHLYKDSPLFSDVHDLLKSMGFEYQGAYEQLAKPQDGRILQQDSIFVRSRDSIFDKTKGRNVDMYNIVVDSQPASQPNQTPKDIDQIRSQLSLKTDELTRIYHSRGWRFVLYTRKILKFLFPREGIRRKILAFLYGISKKSVKLYLKIRDEAYSTPLLLKNYFIKLKPRKKRKINRKSKKIVFVGHSYHTKTRSEDFLIDYLKEFYDVEIILDETWIGKSFPDLSFIDESYLGVIFFQLLPEKSVMDTIKNDNLLHFPMYDHSGWYSLKFWDDYRGFKMINFSKVMQTKLSDWGFESMYVQYFPKPIGFFPGKKDEVFFWQRWSNININNVSKLFSKGNYKIHLHKAVDPGHGFVQPGKALEKKFSITYSDWFENKSAALDVIKQKGIYIAPRACEGIGMSYLEAMAMGKAVIACDNPTMNEYIVHGKTGYLFDLTKAKPINLSDIENVQRNAYSYMQDGYKRWQKERSLIIDFIERP